MDIQKKLFQYVFDASSLINIERTGKMAYLRRRREEILIPEKIAKEVNLPQSPLHRFLIRYPEVVTSFQNGEDEEYLWIRSQVGIDDGEAAAMAIALKRKFTLVIDERDTKANGKAKNHGIKTLSWKEFLRGS